MFPFTDARQAPDLVIPGDGHGVGPVGPLALMPGIGSDDLDPERRCGADTTCPESAVDIGGDRYAGFTLSATCIANIRRKDRQQGLRLDDVG